MIKPLLRTIRRLRGASGKTFVSFEPYLEEICRHFQPRKVLEFGPGKSTQILIVHGAADIVSIEESREWYEKYRRQFEPHGVRVIHKPSGWDLIELREFDGPFDLVFVDGGDRTAELQACASRVAEDGIVFLHDAHREEYEPGIRAYPFVFFPERHSCVMCRRSDVLERLQRVLPPDYGCRCKYCGTEERRRYLAKFIDRGQTRPNASKLSATSP